MRGQTAVQPFVICEFLPVQSTVISCGRSAMFWIGLLSVLLGGFTVFFGQGGGPARVTASAGTPLSATVNSVMAGHEFHQRGDGTANVAVNYDFVHSTYRDAPNLRV